MTSRRREACAGFHIERTDIRYTTANQRNGQADLTGELIIMNWKPSELGQLSD